MMPRTIFKLLNIQIGREIDHTELKKIQVMDEKIMVLLDEDEAKMLELMQHIFGGMEKQYITIIKRNTWNKWITMDDIDQPTEYTQSRKVSHHMIGVMELLSEAQNITSCLVGLPNGKQTNAVKE
ncbi:hypothetical protein CR513_11991, partial [Mucuna pruriens]